MGVSAVNSVSGTSGGRFSSYSSSELENMAREKMRLQRELEELRRNDFMGQSDKQAKVLELSSKINNLTSKMQSMSKSESEPKKQDYTSGNEKRTLENEKTKLQGEISEINSSNNMTAQEKNSEIQKLLMKINVVNVKIQGLTVEKYSDSVHIFGSNVLDNDDESNLYDKDSLSKKESEKKVYLTGDSKKFEFFERININI